MKEIWKPVKGFEEWAEISNYGLIHRFEREWYSGRNHQSKRIQEESWTYGYEDKNSYFIASIGGKTFRVNRLVYITFVGEIPDGLEVNHIDEDKHNNCVWNLNLMTPKDNSNWGTRNERIAAALRGKYNTKCSKPVQALDPTTMEVVMEFASTKEAGRQGFNQGNVAACCRNCFNRPGNNVYKGYIWRFKEKKKIK